MCEAGPPKIKLQLEEEMERRVANLELINQAHEEPLLWSSSWKYSEYPRIPNLWKYIVGSIVNCLLLAAVVKISPWFSCQALLWGRAIWVY